ncbi:MAG: GPP34 family phosphoprotein [Acidobacteriota bacterium]
MLSFAEEILLLALDSETGEIKELPSFSLDGALASAVLLELAFMNRVDYDQTSLRVIDTTSTGNLVLDGTLRALDRRGSEWPISDALYFLSEQALAIRERILGRLVASGVVKMVDKKVFWVFGRTQVPSHDGRETKEIGTRLRDLILSDTIPDPRDAVLVSLVDACAMWDEVFSPAELDQVRARIQTLARMELMGRTLRSLLVRLNGAGLMRRG